MSVLRLPVLSCGLGPHSNSRNLAAIAVDKLVSAGHDSTLVDLRDHPLPSFDNDRVFASDSFLALHRKISEADGVVLAFPIYNWAPSAAVKNLVEATGATGDGARRAAWFDKVVTFIGAAGLPHSYMATGPLAASMMLDFKCIINPHIGYFSDRDWQTSGVLTAARDDRLAKTLDVHVELATLLQSRSITSGWEL